MAGKEPAAQLPGAIEDGLRRMIQDASQRWSASSGRTTSPSEEAAAAMREIMDGEATPAQIGGVAGRRCAMKGETVEEITGFARAMREQVACASGRGAPTWWTPAAPAATGVEDLQHLHRRGVRGRRARAWRWPSTATARSPAAAAAPTCWRRWA